MTKLELTKLVSYINALLQIHLFKDYCPNGLQIQGKTPIKKIVTGVTACQALINAAIKTEADVLLVHHGFFWQGEPAPIIGMKAARIGALMRNHINLLAYHLPLDGHLTLGNNIQLAKVLNIPNPQAMTVEQLPNLFWFAEYDRPFSLAQFTEILTKKLNRQVLVEPLHPFIKKIGWCSGGAQDYIYHAIHHGCDTFLTGEVSERTIHIARENAINFISAGHHATERYGIQALGDHLAEHFNVEHQFIDIENPA